MKADALIKISHKLYKMLQIIFIIVKNYAPEW